jgi:hypothetical protein
VWPFGRKKVGAGLAAASREPPGEEPAYPARVSVLTTIVSPSLLVSPFTGMRTAILFVELLERLPISNAHRAGDLAGDQYVLFGRVVLGDMATLRDEDGDEITIVARRAQVQPAIARGDAAPLVHVPPEIAPLLDRASGRGVLCYRELPLGTGDRVRLEAVVEPTHSVVTAGYRSGTRVTYVARDDLAPVVLAELFEPPAW